MTQIKPTASIITIGDEILIGQIVDTNSAWLADHLFQMGFQITRISSISDSPEQLIEQLNICSKDNDLVIITGGLGPTNDDRTRQALADFHKDKLITNEEVLDDIKSFIVKRKGRLELSENNRAQAFVLSKAKILRNLVGTAPSMIISHNDAQIITMPGVPFEMKWLSENQVFPYLKKQYDLKPGKYKTLHVSGYPESTLANKLADWEEKLPKDIQLAYLPSPGIIRLRITHTNNDEYILEQLADELYEILGDSIVAEGKQKVEYLLAKAIESKRLTLSVAESCSGGKISGKITSIPGCSAFYKGSVTAYSNEIKQKFLNVSQETLDKHGAVSKETALEMVKGIAGAFKTDLAVATTGIAGPDGGTENKPVGTVWIATYYKGEARALHYHFWHDRAINIERTSTVAMYDLLRRLYN